MKRKWLLLAALCCSLSVGIFAACDNAGGDANSSQGTQTEQSIAGVTFEDKTVTYDGTQQEIVVKGTLPKGVTVSYTGNKGTDAGEYEATAVLSGEGYKTLTLDATLTIERAALDLSGVTFEGKTFMKGEEAHAITIEGEETLPAGVTVTYTYTKDGEPVESAVEAGEYVVTATFTGKNYRTATMRAQLRIVDLASFAQGVMDSFGSVPDVWEFLPESFKLDADRATELAATQLDFTAGFVDVTRISDKAIGKQLDVVYGTIITMQSLMGHVNTVYNALSTIGNLYQSFINNNLDGYKSFTGSTSIAGVSLSFRVEVSDEEYILCAGISAVKIELRSAPQTGAYWGRVEAGSVGSLKFEAGENNLIIAIDIAGHARTMMQFVCDDNGAVTGYLYESLDAVVKEFGTTALLTWDGSPDGTVCVAGENGDFFPGAKGRVVEMYSAETGKYIAGKVKEDIGASYDTYWFPIQQVHGVDSVKAVKKSGLGSIGVGNAHEIYVNSRGTVFTPKSVGGIGLDIASRRFDIEMKKVYYYTYDAEEESFTKVSCEIPMLFVQEDYLTSFTEDVQDENPGLTLSVETSPGEIALLDGYYETQLIAYDAIKELVTPDMVVGFIESDTFYNETTA